MKCSSQLKRVLALVLAACSLTTPALGDQSTFSNTAAITIPGTDTAATVDAASPYPSNIAVSGLSGTITSITVTLSSFNHAACNDVDIVLIAPTGAAFTILSDVAGGANCGASPVTITLSDAAAANLPTNGGTLSTGTFKPTDFDSSSGTVEDLPFPAPAPAGPYPEPAPRGLGDLCHAIRRY